MYQRRSRVPFAIQNAPRKGGEPELRSLSNTRLDRRTKDTCLLMAEVYLVISLTTFRSSKAVSDIQRKCCLVASCESPELRKQGAVRVSRAISYGLLALLDASIASQRLFHNRSGGLVRGRSEMGSQSNHIGEGSIWDGFANQ